MWPPCRKERTISSLDGSIRGGSVRVTREPGHPRAVREIRLAGVRAPQGVADEALAVPLEVRVEGQPVDRLDLLRPREQVDRLDLPGQVQEEVGPGVRVVGEGIEDARLLADEEPVAPGIAGDEQGMVELQIRERANDLEGRRRVGRAHDPGGRPGRPTRPGGPGVSGLASVVRGRAEPGHEARREQERRAWSGTGEFHRERMTAWAPLRNRDPAGESTRGEHCIPSDPEAESESRDGPPRSAKSGSPLRGGRHHDSGATDSRPPKRPARDIRSPSSRPIGASSRPGQGYDPLGTSAGGLAGAGEAANST